MYVDIGSSSTSTVIANVRLTPCTAEWQKLISAASAERAGVRLTLSAVIRVRTKASWSRKLELPVAPTTIMSAPAATYTVTDDERQLRLRQAETEVVIAQNRDGYAMLAVRGGVDGRELERYYGFDMALDHAAELLGVSVGEIEVPAEASDMGM
jgi:hypothetical protein